MELSCRVVAAHVSLSFLRSWWAWVWMPIPSRRCASIPCPSNWQNCHGSHGCLMISCPTLPPWGVKGFTSTYITQLWQSWLPLSVSLYILHVLSKWKILYLVLVHVESRRIDVELWDIIYYLVRRRSKKEIIIICLSEKGRPDEYLDRRGDCWTRTSSGNRKQIYLTFFYSLFEVIRIGQRESYMEMSC